MAYHLTSPEVPHGYDLQNTYESDFELETVRTLTINALKNLGVVTMSPDGLMCICKALFDHQIFSFWVVLFHSKKGEFVELRCKQTDFRMIEEEFARITGFSPSERNFKPCVMLPFPFPEHILEPYESNLCDDIEKATFYTEDDASYRDSFWGVSLCRKIFETSKPEILTKRLYNFALYDQNADLRCLALDALSDPIVAEHASTDSDALIRRTANIILGI